MNQKPTYEELERRIRDLESSQADTRRLEKDYLEQKRLLETIINELPFWFSLKDRAGKYLLVNNHLADAHGMQASAFLNLTTLEMPELYPGGLKKMVERDNQVLKTGERIEVPDYQVDIGGEVRWRRLVKVPWTNDKGEILGVVSWSEDITEVKRTREELCKYQDHLEDLVDKRTAELQAEITSRKQFEMALERSEKRLREVIQLSDAGYFLIDLDGCFQKVNKAWLRLHKFENENDIIGKHFSLTQTEKYNFEAQEIFAQLISGKKIKTGEFSRRCKDGSIGYHFFTARPVKRAEEIIGVEGFIIDNTENKRLEEQILRSKKMAAIGTLAGGVAHEFNNMLAIMLGNNELILEELPQYSLARESAEEIRIAGLRARDVVKQLLTFSSKDDAVKKVVDIKSVVQESMKLICSTTPANIEIEQNLSTDTLPILGNDVQINQILINLCNNAIDAMPEKGGKIIVELSNEIIKKEQTKCHTKLKPGQYVKLLVNDNGIGMDTETLERVFEPYFTTKDFGKGSGIGMAVIHGIVERHDGVILVESHPGQGTAIAILIPIHEGPLEQEIGNHNNLPAGEECILYVDDETSIANLGKRLLESLGYRAESTTDPLKALEMVKANPQRFDLVLTDMAMPNMTGDQLIEEILKIRQDMPTIICTGYSAKFSENEALEMGISSFAMKPLVKADLAKTVRNVLDAAKTSNLEKP